MRRVGLAFTLVVGVLLVGLQRWSTDLAVEVSLARAEARRGWLTTNDCGVMVLSEYGLGRASLSTGSPYAGTEKYFLFGIGTRSRPWEANEDLTLTRRLESWLLVGGGRPTRRRDLCAETRAELRPGGLTIARSPLTRMRFPIALDGVALEKAGAIEPGRHVLAWQDETCEFTLVATGPGEGRLDSSDPCVSRFQVRPALREP